MSCYSKFDDCYGTYPELEDAGGWGGGPTSFINFTRSLKNNSSLFMIDTKLGMTF